MAIYNNCPIISVGNIPAGTRKDYKTGQIVPTSPSVDIGVVLPNGRTQYIKLYTTEKAKPYTVKKLKALDVRFVGRMPVFPDNVYQQGIAVLEKPDDRNPERMQYDVWVPRDGGGTPRQQQQQQYQQPPVPAAPAVQQAAPAAPATPAYQEYPPQSVAANPLGAAVPQSGEDLFDTGDIMDEGLDNIPF